MDSNMNKKMNFNVNGKAKNDDSDDCELGLADMLSLMAPEANLQLADPSLVNYYKNYKNRTLSIVKDIDDSLFMDLMLIRQWNMEDEKNNIPIEKRLPIKMLINTYGGSLDSALAIADIMNLSKTPIATINLQCALSAGSLILLNGTPGMRYCFKMSEALIHDGSGGSGGSYSAVVAQTENYKKIIQMTRDNIIDHTKIDQKTLNKWKGKEIYLYAEDQIKYGLVDHIVTDITQIF